MNTHGKKIHFGKHRGELITRVPLSYIRWMINNNSMQSDLAKAEFERRGDTMPQVEISGHAIDKASWRILHIWQEDRQKDEGLYSWLQRVVLEALEQGIEKNNKIIYKGMGLAIEQGEEFPVLKTIVRAK